MHICHLSTAGSVEIVRWAKSKGWDVTAEVTPHHLLLTDELVRSYDPVYKVNPPLRTEADVLALREALADGTIDCVATDHAPHPHEDKDCEWGAAAMGMVGLETALSVVQHTMVDTGLLDWARRRRPDVRPARRHRPARRPRPARRRRRARQPGCCSTRTTVVCRPRGLRLPQPQHPVRRAASCRDASPPPSCGAGDGRGREARVNTCNRSLPSPPRRSRTPQQGHRLADRIGWVVGLLLFVALVYWLMRQGWKWRGTLQARPARAAGRARRRARHRRC